MSETVILVDENDNQIGTEEKITAHREGKLHRAFTIMVFNSKGEMLLTRRAKTKYHWGGFWTNACDGHPRPGESVEEAGLRRLKEELGIECGLKELFKFIYKVRHGDGLFEHEVDHVLVGVFDGSPKDNLEEFDKFKWVGMEELKGEISDSTKYAPWFQIAFEKMSGFDVPKILNG